MTDRKYLSRIPETVILEDVSCPVCKSSESQEHQFDGFDRINGLEGLFGVDLCRKCGLYITNPRPSQDTIGYYYPDSYGPYKSTLIQKKSIESVLRSIGEDIFDTRGTYIHKDIPNGIVLDIGCASGSFLRKMQQSGWKVEGLEFSQMAVDNARNNGLDVQQGSVLDASFDEEKFDLITAWMVLEHIHDPVATLNKIDKWLKPGGRLAISVPNANSIDFQWMKDCSYGIHLPNHLYHFTPQTITNLLENSGFKNIRIYHQRTLGSIIPSFGYYLKERGIMMPLANRLIAYPQAHKAIKLAMFPLSVIFAFVGQTGRMTVHADKG